MIEKKKDWPENSGSFFRGPPATPGSILTLIGHWLSLRGNGKRGRADEPEIEPPDGLIDVADKNRVGKHF